LKEASYEVCRLSPLVDNKDAMNSIRNAYLLSSGLLVNCVPRWWIQVKTLPRLDSTVARSVISLIILVLCGCVVSDAPVFGANDADNVVGIAGRWRDQSSAAGKDLFIRRNADSTYSSGDAPEKYNLQWVCVALGDDFFIVQNLTGRDVFLFLVLVRSQSFLVFNFPSKTMVDAAWRIGLDIRTGDGGARIPHNAGKINTIAFFKELKKLADPTDAKIYVRLK
jgi:hypothetical protein